MPPAMEAGWQTGDTATQIRSIQSVLQSATANEIPAGDKQPIVISDDMLLVDALKFIADAWIRACPVRNAQTNTIIGTLDLRDIGQFMVSTNRSHSHPIVFPKSVMACARCSCI